MFKAGASLSKFHREDERCDFQVGGYFGAGRRRGGTRGGPVRGASTNPPSSVPLCMYAFDKGSSLKWVEVDVKIEAFRKLFV